MTPSRRRPAVPILHEEDVRRLVTVEDALRTVEATYAAYGRYRKVLSDPPAMVVTPSPGNAVFKVKGAHLADEGITGLRIIADRRTGGGEATIDYCWVAEALTGAPIGLVSETWLHRLRTAVTGMVAARFLARPDSRVAVIIGAGPIADELPAAIRAAFGVEDIRVVARTAASAERFRIRHAASGVTASSTVLDDVIAGADLVFGISSAAHPVVAARHMAPGRFVCGLGGGSELSYEALEHADGFVVDEFDYATTIGSIRGWIAAGVDPAAIRARVDADIGEVVAGTRPPPSPQGRNLAIIQGMAVCDLALAHLALVRAGMAAGSQP